MQKRSTVYGEFKIEHDYRAPASKVYNMFADKQSKEKWFFKASGDGEAKHTMDFKVGGGEVGSGKFHNGVTHTFKATYYDIVPNERIVYCYEMYLDDKRISVSVATLEFTGEGDNTKLVLHEAGVFLDEFDKPEIRERGSKDLLIAIEEAINS